MVDSWQVLTAARTLWQEARGEPLEGQKAIWNRLRARRWGTTLASVCLWTGQFSGWRSSDPNFAVACALQDDDADLLRLSQIMLAAEDAEDPTGGATHYFSPSMRTSPLWSLNATYCGTFGRQRFYKNVR